MLEDIVSFTYGGYGSTCIHPLVAIVLVTAAVLIVRVKVHNLLAVILPLIILIPLSQRIVVFGLDFMIFRLLLMIAWLRVLAKGEQKVLKLNAMDRLFIGWLSASVFLSFLNWGTWGYLVNRAGFAFNALGTYFLCRIVLENTEALNRTIIALSFTTLLVAATMIYEHETAHNAFAFVGGMPEKPSERMGRLRSQGPFPHSIMAGAFGACWLPVFLMQMRQTATRRLAACSAVAAIVIVITSASSGPVLAALGGLAGVLFWRARAQLRLLCGIIPVVLLALHMLMKAPVWAVLARIRLVGGSTGFHRYQIIDQFINRFEEWWLHGVKTTNDWGWNMWDRTNEYVVQGTTGGLLSLLLFLAIITLSFKTIGRLSNRKEIRAERRRLYWALGSSQAAYAVSFFGMNLWGQTQILWYVLLAATGAGYGMLKRIDSA